MRDLLLSYQFVEEALEYDTIQLSEFQMQYILLSRKR